MSMYESTTHPTITPAFPHRTLDQAGTPSSGTTPLCPPLIRPAQAQTAVGFMALPSCHLSATMLSGISRQKNSCREGTPWSTLKRGWSSRPSEHMAGQCSSHLLVSIPVAHDRQKQFWDRFVVGYWDTQAVHAPDSHMDHGGYLYCVCPHYPRQAGST